MNKFKKYLKLFIFIICISFLFYQFTDISTEILGKVQIKITESFFLLFLTIIFFNIINLRAFLLTKSSAGYAYSYSDWSKLYFESLIVNSVIPISGTVYRAIQLKKKRSKLFYIYCNKLFVIRFIYLNIFNICFIRIIIY